MHAYAVLPSLSYVAGGRIFKWVVPNRLTMLPWPMYRVWSKNSDVVERGWRLIYGPSVENSSLTDKFLLSLSSICKPMWNVLITIFLQTVSLYDLKGNWINYEVIVVFPNFCILKVFGQDSKLPYGLSIFTKITNCVTNFPYFKPREDCERKN